MTRPRHRLLTAIVTLGLALAVVGPAAALSITTAAISFSSVTLTGTDQTVSGSTSAWRADASGETGGWHLTVAAGDFSNGSETIAVSNFELRLLDANITVVSGDPTGPVSTQTSFVALSATPRTIASAADATGDGVYDLTPDTRLTLPAEIYTGSYSATVTVTVAVGP